MTAETQYKRRRNFIHKKVFSLRKPTFEETLIKVRGNFLSLSEDQQLAYDPHFLRQMANGIKLLHGQASKSQARGAKICKILSLPLERNLSLLQAANNYSYQDSLFSDLSELLSTLCSSLESIHESAIFQDIGSAEN